MKPEHLGYIPFFLSESDPRPAAEQIGEKYVGGWRPFYGFQLSLDDMTLKYPEDPPMKPLASTQLRNEHIFYYEHSWVLILQEDDPENWQIARLD